MHAIQQMSWVQRVPDVTSVRPVPAALDAVLMSAPFIGMNYKRNVAEEKIQ
jgi:hypothetical protein